MRALVVFAVVAALVGVPSVAEADGGAYISLDKTYYVVGSTAVAKAYVAIPKSKRSLLSRGPFYAYVMDEGSSLRIGTIPANAVRVGTFTVHPEGSAFEFEARFTVTSVSLGWHTLAFCNDPCTISGFREPLTGSLYVVETQREAELLIENGKLQGQLSGTKRQLSKAQRELETARHDLADADQKATRSLGQVWELKSGLAAANDEAAQLRERSATEHRAALVLAAELALGIAVLVLLKRRRRKRSSLPQEGVAIT
jgi:hypothetical protein